MLGTAAAALLALQAAGCEVLSPVLVMKHLLAAGNAAQDLTLYSFMWSAGWGRHLLGLCPRAGRMKHNTYRIHVPGVWHV